MSTREGPEFETTIVGDSAPINGLVSLCKADANPAPRWVGTLSHHPTTRIWSMIEVTMVGVLVW